MRNGFSLVVERQAQFLDMHLKIRDHNTDFETASQFWKALSIPADRVESIALADPVFRGGFLWINPCSIETGEVAMPMVSEMLLYILKLRPFTNSRWLSMGVSARALVAGLAAGLDQWVAMTRADPGASDYYLHGWSRLVPRVKYLACISALISYPAESGLVAMLTDDRLALQAAEVQQDMADEVSWVSNLHPVVWQRLADIAGEEYTAQGLYAHVMHACHTSMAYARHKTFSVLEAYPWKLVSSGSILQNVKDLEACTEPIRDPLTHKVRLLARTDFGHQNLVEALTLLQQWPWSSTLVEQSHASAAVLRRYHPTYEPQMLSARASLHQCRHILQIDTPLTKLAAMEERVKARRARKNPYKASGKTALFGHLVAAAQEALPAGTRMSQALKVDIMRQHKGIWDDLSPDQQQIYQAQARDRAQRRAAVLDADLRRELDAIKLQRNRLKTEALEEGLKVATHTGRFQVEDYEAMVRRLEEAPLVTQPDVQELREVTTAPPEAPAKQVLDQFAEVPCYCAPEPVLEMDDWIKDLCRGRDEAQGCTVAFSLEEGSKAFLLLYATKSPLHASFLCLIRESLALPLLPRTTEALMDMASTWVPHRYVIDTECPYCTGFDIPTPEDPGACGIVFEDMQFQAGSILASHIPPCPCHSI